MNTLVGLLHFINGVAYRIRVQFVPSLPEVYPV